MFGKKETIEVETPIGKSQKEVFDWYLRPHAIERFLPPQVKLVKGSLPSEVGSEVLLNMALGPIHFQSIFEHSAYKEGCFFVDVQKKGPFQSFQHTHEVISEGPQSSLCRDRVEYSLYGLSSVFRKKLGDYIRWRHYRLQNDLILFSRYPFVKKKILVSGSSGFLGRELVSFLKVCGHDVICLVRKQAHKKDAISWYPEKEGYRLEDFEGFDAIIHLAAENIASGYWTKEKKERFFTTRCRNSWLLAKIISRLDRPPKQLICASAIGYYGNRPGEVVDEASEKGTGFLADLCDSWEKATDFLTHVQVVHARFGLILGHQGGVLPQLLKPIRFGFGIVIGDGSQMISWISIDDAVGALYHLLHQDIKGPVVFASQNPQSQEKLIRELCRRYNRKRILHVGNFFGEMGRELLLTSCSAKPSRLLETGYRFLHPRLEDILWHD